MPVVPRSFGWFRYYLAFGLFRLTPPRPQHASLRPSARNGIGPPRLRPHRQEKTGPLQVQGDVVGVVGGARLPSSCSRSRRDARGLSGPATRGSDRRFAMAVPKGRRGHSHQNLSFVDLKLSCSQTVPYRSTMDLRSTNRSAPW